MTRYDLKDRIAIITGSSDGLGEQFAYALAESGAKVVLASRNENKLQTICDEIKSKYSVEAIPVKTDVMIEQDIVSLVERTVEQFGSLDIMVNNVGNYISKPLLEHTLDDWRFVIDLNLTSTFLGSREAARAMIPKKKGSIINMASIFGYGATQFPVVSYYAAKGGVISLTKALAVELGSHNIRVNAIAPGFFPTQQSEGALSDEAILKELIRPRTALPYLAQKEWIRGAICFLASDDSKFITGHTLVVDGGWLAF